MDILEYTLYLLPLFLTSVMHDAAGKNISISNPKYFHTRQTSSENKWYKMPHTYDMLPKTLVDTIYTITGFIPSNAGKFTVELCLEFDCFPVVAFHFSVRLNRHFVARTHMVDGIMAKEERKGDMPFNRGTNFKLAIKAAESKYQVYVNGLYFCEYRYAVPKQQVGFIKVFGDVHINRTSVSVDYINIGLRRTIAVGDWVRFEMTPKSFSEIMLIEIGNEDKAIAQIRGIRQTNFTFRCNNCAVISLDLFYGDQEKFILELEFLSDAVIKIYNDKRYLKTVTLNLKYELAQANLIHLDTVNHIECFRIP